MRTFPQDDIEWAATLDLDSLVAVTRTGEPVHVADADHDRDFQPLCAVADESGFDIVDTIADCPDCQHLLQLTGHIVTDLFDLPTEYVLKFKRIGRTRHLKLVTQARTAKELDEHVTAFARRFLRCADFDVVVSLDAGEGRIFCGRWRVASFTIDAVEPAIPAA